MISRVTRHDERTLAAGTWRALLSPRRAVPIGLVLVGLVAAEWSETGSLRWIAMDLVLFAAFVLLAPYGWRLVCSGRASFARNAAYAAAMSALVAALGSLLPRAFAMHHPYILDPSGLPLIAVLFVAGGWGLGRDIELEAGFEAERDRASRLALEAQRAELLALRANLDPHFLFNTLNAIAEWCREDPAVAERATLELASMLRTMLQGIRAPSWPLATELGLVRALLELHAIRDRARYASSIDTPDPPPDAQLPPMLLLPLVENAITHGPAAGHEGEIIVRVSCEADRILLEIENPGPFEGRREGGEGIAMVERRLALAYGEDARLELSSDGARTTARLSMPTIAEKTL